MKNKKTILGLAAAFLFASIFLISCSNETKNNDHKNEHSATNENAEHNHATHSHDDGNDHMAHMNEVRESLKKELGDKYDAVVPAASKEQSALGEKIYKQTCLSCHGEQGKGDGPASKELSSPPADFTDGGHATFYSEEGRRQIIRKGIAGTAMVAWDKTLSEEEIDAVYAFIKSLIKKEGVQNESHDGHNHEH